MVDMFVSFSATPRLITLHISEKKVALVTLDV